MDGFKEGKAGLMLHCTSNIKIMLGIPADIDEIEALYDDLNDYLACTINYPGWGRGSYPVREQAESGVESKTLYIARDGERIAGSIILNHSPDYTSGPVLWGIHARDEDVLYIHTLVVHPDYLKNGIGGQLLEFGFDMSIKLCMKAIRLDVYKENMPAIRLYEKLGYAHRDTVDLGLGCYGLDWFKLYEKAIP